MSRRPGYRPLCRAGGCARSACRRCPRRIALTRHRVARSTAVRRRDRASASRPRSQRRPRRPRRSVRDGRQNARSADQADHRERGVHPSDTSRSSGSQSVGTVTRFPAAERTDAAQRQRNDLSREPAGLADGLALKEPALPRSLSRIRPKTWVPRSLASGQGFGGFVGGDASKVTRRLQGLTGGREHAAPHDRRSRIGLLRRRSRRLSLRRLPLGGRPMAGHQVLVLRIGVRIPAPQLRSAPSAPMPARRRSV